MGGVIEQRLIALAGMTPADGAAFAERLHALVEAADAGPAVAANTPGTRNQRLLRLHAQLVGGRLEACAACPACGESNEFDVPADALLALPPPVEPVAVAGSLFRLPRMADLDAAGTEPLPWRIARRCRLTGDTPLDAALIEAVGAAFDAADPAAAVTLALDCARCAEGFPVAVDVALLVGEACARLADSLLREVDTLATAYGWTEPDVLALPAERRRRYVALVAGRRTAGDRARLVELSA